MREPNFNNLLKVLKKEKPDRPTLFEFFLNEKLYKKLANNVLQIEEDELSDFRIIINAFKNAGYDYATVSGSSFHFPTGKRAKEKSVSMNEGCLIHDRKSLLNYAWPDANSFDYSKLSKIESELPNGMKLIVSGPNGILENVIDLVGYENLCYMLFEERELVKDIFNNVGIRMLKYYENSLKFNTVGAIISNDDWGFNSQTLLSPNDLREFVFPWYKRIVTLAHEVGKPVILHSCGKLDLIMDDIIYNMKFDGKHSYEDKIRPVEEAYDIYGDKIAILGGIDLNFICTKTPDEIHERSKKLLIKTKNKGGYALGTGNSVPDYVPDANYFAMINTINDIDLDW